MGRAGRMNARQQRAADGNAPQAAGDQQPAAAIPPVVHQVQVSLIDTYMPTIAKVAAADVAAKFKFPSLTKINGRPTYAAISVMREELYANALAVPSSFGGGQLGHLGMVMPAAVCQVEANTEWHVPDSEGRYPNFPINATDEQKKELVATFVQRESDIKMAEVVKTLLHNLILDAVDKAYVAELKHTIYRYDRVEPRALLDHLFNHYARLDD